LLEYVKCPARNSPAGGRTRVRTIDFIGFKKKRPEGSFQVVQAPYGKPSGRCMYDYTLVEPFVHEYFDAAQYKFRESFDRLRTGFR
jgi:hypothetical protein